MSKELIGHISLGSNLGNKARNLRLAAERLDGNGIQIRRSSHLYLTEPVDGAGPEWFINSDLEIITNLNPWDLLDRCLDVEVALGRQRLPFTRARTVDLDILLLDRIVLEEPRLTIPHPTLHQRKFVLDPLCELAPDIVHPSLGETMSQLRQTCSDPSLIMRIP